MMSNYQDLQDKRTKNDLKLSTELYCANQEHEKFKQEICNEMMSLQNSGLPISSSSSSPNNLPSTTVTQVTPVSSSLSSVIHISIAPSTLFLNSDFQM